MDEPSADHELDLPLFSNIDEVHVQHYILDLTCHSDSRTFEGSVTLICDRINQADKEPSDILHVLNDGNDETSNDCYNIQGQSDPSCKDSDAASIAIVTDHGYCVPLLPQDAVKALDNETSASNPDKPFDELHDKLTRESDDFVMKLDAWDLDIEKVHKLILKPEVSYSDVKDDKVKLKEFLDTCDLEIVQFCSKKKYLEILIPSRKCNTTFPHFIRIFYKTQSHGPSLKWTTDQDDRACVYTHGHWINNRSLYPSQDVPGALATWSAHITVPDGQIVLMSGDFNAVVMETILPGYKTYFCQTEMEVPSSTLALAVGYWCCAEMISANSILESSEPTKVVPCRLFSPRCHLTLAQSLLSDYIPRCMDAAYNLLGSHPFRRLDILIVPTSLASLGMASPSLMFLSQSVLSEDRHMLVRVAHELSHSWFGLVIGPRDWHEEWLSEGFCTYTEAIIHAKANKVPDDEFRAEQEIYDYLKYNTLKAEQQSVGDDLQMLRNTSDKDFKHSRCDTKYVLNGINPDKGFLQVHYVKGYFLLRHLEDEVGTSRFREFLKHLVMSFTHMLIDSMDVLGLFFKMFPEKRKADFCEETLIQTWLNCPGIPEVLMIPVMNNNIITKEMYGLEEKICECNERLLKMHWRKRQKIDLHSLLEIPQLKVVQVLLLLDRLLQYKRIHSSVLLHLNEKLCLSISNADVRHKWCELVVKHNLSKHYSDVWYFLENYQAMGVYLFGELVISKDKEQRQLAQDCFKTIAAEMEDGVRNIVRTMLYG